MWAEGSRTGEGGGWFSMDDIDMPGVDFKIDLTKGTTGFIDGDELIMDKGSLPEAGRSALGGNESDDGAASQTSTTQEIAAEGTSVNANINDYNFDNAKSDDPLSFYTSDSKNDISEEKQGNYIGGESGKRNPSKDKKLSPWQIKKLKDKGWDHSEKNGGAHGGGVDLYYDPETGVVYEKPKGGNGFGEPTEWNVHDIKTVSVAIGVGIAVYEGIKWVGAALLAPETGGASLVGAAALP